MKNKSLVFISIGIILQVNLFGKNYYVSSTSGNDANTDVQAQNKNTPWKSIDKVNSMMSLFSAGDSILFKRGDVFTGALIITKSGSSVANIVFGTYGTGEKPCINGTSNITGWTETSPHLWEASCTDCGTKVTNFFINNRPQQIGRWPNVTDPNKGYLTYESHSGTNQITDEQLTGSIDWTGAEAVVRRTRWILDRLIIKSHQGTTLTFTTNVSYEFINGFGYFIQNDPRTLDQEGEWYYNPNNKRLLVYYPSDLNSQKTEANYVSTLLKIWGQNYITVENLCLKGSLSLSLDVNNCKNIKISNVDILYAGENAVSITNCDYVTFENNLINHTNNNAFQCHQCNYATIRNNRIKNTALVAGMGLGGDGQYNANYMAGKNVLFEKNIVDSVGYIGVSYGGDSITLRNNVISNYCMTKDDGGGLYTWSDGTKTNYCRKLIGNIVFNAIGAPEGSGWTGVAAEGIYVDDRSANVDITGNTVFNCGNNGIVIHNSNHINIIDNTVYDNDNQLIFVHDDLAPSFPITNCTMNNNIFFARQINQMVAKFQAGNSSIDLLGNFDYNYYCRPFDDNLVIYASSNTTNPSIMDLTEWQTTCQKDSHSKKSPRTYLPYKVDNLIGPNLFTNGTFDKNISGWYCWANYNNCVAEFDNTDKLDSGSMKLHFDTLTGKPDAYMLAVGGIGSVTAGKKYILKFSHVGLKEGKTVEIILRKNGSPYNSLASQGYFLTSTTRKECEILFEVTTTEANARIDFRLDEGDSTVWLDNIDIREANVTKTSPDDYIRFAYNPTNSPVDIILHDNYIDVRNNKYSGKITLAPYSSIILLKDTASNTTPPTLISPVMERHKGSYKIFPNPASEYIMIDLNECAEKNIKIRILNGIGNPVLEKNLNNNATEKIDISSLPAGLYLININNEFYKFIKP